jgi:hypothetical protein
MVSKWKNQFPLEMNKQTKAKSGKLRAMTCRVRDREDMSKSFVLVRKLNYCLSYFIKWPPGRKSAGI